MHDDARVCNCLIGCQHPYGMLELSVHVAHCMYLYEQYHDLLLSLKNYNGHTNFSA